MTEKLRESLILIHNIANPDYDLITSAVSKLDAIRHNAGIALNETGGMRHLTMGGVVEHTIEVPYLKGRELFAAHALQGLLAKSGHRDGLVEQAVNLADDTIRQLEVTKS